MAEKYYSFNSKILQRIRIAADTTGNSKKVYDNVFGTGAGLGRMAAGVDRISDNDIMAVSEWTGFCFGWLKNKKCLHTINSLIESTNKIIEKSRAKYTKRALAKRLGCSEQYVGHILTGKRRLPKKYEGKIRQFINN